MQKGNAVKSPQCVALALKRRCAAAGRSLLGQGTTTKSIAARAPRSLALTITFTRCGLRACCGPVGTRQMEWEREPNNAFDRTPTPNALVNESSRCNVVMAPLFAPRHRPYSEFLSRISVFLHHHACGGMSLCNVLHSLSHFSLNPVGCLAHNSSISKQLQHKSGYKK